MDGLCIRCTRLAIHSSHGARRIVSSSVARKFSTTSIHRDEDSSAPSKPSRTKLEATGRSFSEAMRDTQPSTSDRPLTIRREYVDSPSQQGQRSPPARGNLLIRRTDRPGSNTTPRTGGPPQQGQLLRRSGGPPQGQLLRRSNGPRTTGGPGGNNRPQQAQRRRRRPTDRKKAYQNEDELPTEEELDEYVTKYIDRPMNPTEQITYNPEPQSKIELAKDWPNTPLSPTGLTASLIQKIEWVARRIPHGYQTPTQLAEHYHKGNLTRFESEEEKKLVLQIASDLSKTRADIITERTGEQSTPEDMAVSDVSVDDKQTLVNSVIKGSYTESEKQQMPFLDNIARVLKNNETYGSVEMQKFMAKVQSAMPAKGVRRASPAQKAA